MLRFRVLLLILFIYCKSSFANNIQVTNVTHYTASGIQYVQFNISWENSWRVNSAPFNYDAAWIFVKRRDCAAQQWHHTNLSPSDPDHSGTALLTVDAYSDKKGVMLYRTSTGSGNIPPTEVILKLDAPPAGDYEYKVFAIEMVYVPQGAFYLGDGASNFTFKNGPSLDPVLIGSEASVHFSNTTGDIWTISPYQESFTLPAAYPKGFNAFYCMKYEISQGQYADFLNTLTNDAFLRRYGAANSGLVRYSVGGIWPAMNATAPDRAANYMSVSDLYAYLDWTALSPMSEFEFEKACRGSSVNNAVASEFAWGSANVTDANTIASGTDGMPNESVTDVITTGSGPANFGANIIVGPLRCGFAANGATSRYTAASTYYGIMEMSGNVFELCINADSSLFEHGISFNGSHGDGTLEVTPLAGESNENWPGLADLSTAARGGAWSSPVPGEQLHVSDRTFFYLMIGVGLPGPDANGRSAGLGGRGVSRRQ